MTESTIRQITGIILWSISGLMSLGLYLGYAGVSWISVGISILLSASLEVAKVLSWRRGSWYRAISVCLSGLTLLAVLGTTMIRIESTKSTSLQARLEALQNSRVYVDLLGQQKEAEKQLEALLTRIEGTPADWATVSLKLNAEANDLRKDQSELSSKLTALEQEATVGHTSSEPSIFRALGSVIGQEEERVELVVLLALAVLVEVTAFSLAGHSGGTKTSGVNAPKKAPERQEPQPKPNTKPNPEPDAVKATQFNGGPSAEDYLKVALDHPRKPYLLGRGPVSERLGISEAQAKDLVEELVRDGRVKRESKYFVAV